MTILRKVKKRYWRNHRMWKHTVKQVKVVNGWHLLHMLTSSSASAQTPPQASFQTGSLILEPSHPPLRQGVCVHILFMWVYSMYVHDFPFNPRQSGFHILYLANTTLIKITNDLHGQIQWSVFSPHLTWLISSIWTIWSLSRPWNTFFYLASESPLLGSPSLHQWHLYILLCLEPFHLFDF